MLVRPAVKRVILPVILCLLPLVRFFLEAGRGFDYLMFSYLVDDTFYIYEIAKHIPYFNEGIPNSGFHPMIVFLSAPLQRMTSSYEVAVILSLLIPVLAVCGSGFLLYRLLSVVFDSDIALVALFAWAINSNLFSLTMTGMETPLAAMLCLGAYLAYFTRFLDPARGSPSGWDAHVLGLLCGAAFLARMDAPLILSPMAAHVTWRSFREKDLRNLLLFVVSLSTLPLLWIGYIHHMTGSASPTSSTALRIMRALEGMTLVPFGEARDLAGMVAVNTVLFIVEVPAPLQATGVLVLCLVLCLVVFSRSGNERVRTLFFLIVPGTGVWTAYYILYLGGFRLWYFTYLSIPVFALIVPSILLLLKRMFGSRPLWAIPGLLLVIGLNASYFRMPNAPQEYDKFRSALVAQDLLDKIDTRGRVASFNTGIYDYFMEEDVLNLDGVVNPEVHEVMLKGLYADYLRERNVAYIIEHDFRSTENFYRLLQEERIALRKAFDLSKYYTPYGRYWKKTYLWEVSIAD